ncbi:hypothetical protein ACS0TY_028898 [Phlomoides rotata]
MIVPHEGSHMEYSGVGNDNSHNLLKSHCSQHRPNWLVILEPKVSSSAICRNFLRSLNFIFFAENQRHNMLPNIWIFCSITTAATTLVIGSSEQAIIVCAQHNLLDCTFGFVHAASDYVGRRDLWQFISSLHCTNLCLISDFKAVLGAHERISLRAPSSVSCAEFRGFIVQELLFEVEAVGAAFTWDLRRSVHGLIASKLDRVLAHESFIDQWDSILVTVLARAALDHHLILLQCVKDSQQQIAMPFKFLLAWTLDSRFKRMVRLSWGQSLCASDPIYVVIQKLRRLI